MKQLQSDLAAAEEAGQNQKKRKVAEETKMHGQSEDPTVEQNATMNEEAEQKVQRDTAKI